MEALTEFRAELEQAGLSPGEISPDGVLRRHGTVEKPRSKNGWHVLYGDPWAGAYGNWQTGEIRTWSNGHDIDPEARRRIREQVAREKAEREKEQARSHQEAAREARKIIESLPQATEDNPYLVKKGVKPCPGLKADGETLVVPVCGPDGGIMTYQRIEPDGGKKFMPGGKAAGGYFAIKGSAGPLYIAEGLATGLSLHEATGGTVLVAFNCGNLRAVAEMARQRYPDREIVLAGDNDHQTELEKGTNPGKESAFQAARSVGGKVALPIFQEDGGTDFNDLHQAEGLEGVQEALEQAQEPPAFEAKEDWPDPEPLPDGLPPVADFDLRLIPEALRPWMDDIVDRMQCPPDYVAVTIMTALGGIIGRKVGIRPQESTDWTVTANQWALIIGRPGVLKSPAMEAALSPLKYLAAIAAEKYNQELKTFESAKIINKLRSEAAEKAARKVLKDNPGADVSELLNVEQEEAPVLARYMANDTTAAALGELHRLNPNGLLVYRDELVSLLKMLDQEENSEARGFYLTGWNGDSPYTFDRIQRGLNLHIKAVCLSLLGSTQPARIAQYVKGALRGDGDDGLLQRFGLLVWPDASSSWKDVDRWPDGEAKKRVYEVFNRLDQLKALTIGAHQDDDFNGEPDGIPYLRFDKDGLGLFQEWRQDLEAKLRSGTLHPAEESHYAKYRKLVPGLALIIHLSNGDTGPVRSQAVLMALAWSEYLGTHARRLYSSVTAPEVAAAKLILSKIRSGDLLTVFAGWQVWRPGWSGLTDRKVVYEALNLLADLQWIAIRKKETGGRPGNEYQVNPKTMKEVSR